MKIRHLGARSGPIRSMEGGHWWWAHNVIVDHYGAQLGPHGLAVYCYLCARANEEQQCWPSVPRMARALGMSKRTVQGAIKRLVAAGLVYVQRRVYQDGMHTSNLYTLLPVAVRDAGPSDELSTTPPSDG